MTTIPPLREWEGPGYRIIAVFDEETSKTYLYMHRSRELREEVRARRERKTREETNEN
jgi:hypothetical protein